MARPASQEENLCAGAVGSVVAQITGQRDAHQRIGDDEAVGRERTQPAVNVEAARAAAASTARHTAAIPVTTTAEPGVSLRA